MKECALCQSENIRLTDVDRRRDKQTSIRLFCEGCRKGMTITGILVYTIKDVDG